ncbi:MAG: metallophosphoesterase [Candidatus Electronema sp. V4]|uniref:metallophosphoesterase n=1 Tax=Candidatus Electronema sp. V4 TaxID=3454756 RepID=UPI0040556869
MAAVLFFLRFIAVAGVILAGAHYYLWRCLVKDTGLSGKARRAGTAALVILFFLPLLPRLLERHLPYAYTFHISWLGYLWLGMLLLFFVFFLCADALKILALAARCLLLRQCAKPDPARWQQLSRLTVAAGLLVVLTAAAFGVKKGAEPPAVHRVEIRLDKLPAAFKGFKIVQISDIHIGEMADAADLAETVAIVNRLQPDIVAITGDLVDGEAAQLRGELAPLEGLRAKEGVFFVTGNHEYYSGADDWLPEIKRLGVTVLANERREIRRGEDALVIAGVNDHKAGRFGDPPDYERALGGIAPGRTVILLAHQPAAAKQAAAWQPDLVLSGHMHGGQIWPFKYFVLLQQPYIRGLYREGGTQLYVNQGTATWGPPMRVGTEKEITELILK